jgi:hypothetical protein
MWNNTHLYRLLQRLCTPLFVVSLTSCIYWHESIVSVNSYNEIDFAAIDEKTLVIFDVDETLIQPDDAYVMHEFGSDTKQLQHEFKQRYPHNHWIHFESLITEQASRSLIEPEIIQIIRQLQEKGITVIACTYMKSGPYGHIKALEEWRYNHLKHIGFIGAYENLIVRFSSNNAHPLFYRGILITDAQEKGPVLGAWLDAMHIHPPEIIVFDDYMENITSIARECRKRNITFVGYHYQGAKKKKLDIPTARWQLEKLIESGQWISDEDVQNIIAPPHAIPLQ